MGNHNKQTERVAIVTGGTRGIGLGISKALAENGIKLLLVYQKDGVAAQQAETELNGLGAEVVMMQADVGLKTEAERVAAFAGERWQRIDLLVNNAAIFDFIFIEEMSEAFFDKTYQTNLKSMLFMIQAVLPFMKLHHFGRIVNASSISGKMADVGLCAYACAKAGVDMLTRIAAAEFAPYGITVNAYAPGIITTDMTRPMIEQRGHLQINQIPARRFGDPEDVAGLVNFLCSQEASYITGEIIGVDGGMLKVQNPIRAYEYVEQARQKSEGA